MTVASWIRGMPAGVVQAIKGAFDYPNSVNLTAAGTTLATALPLPRDFNVFTTVAAGTGCSLPSGVDQIPAGNAALAVNLTQSQALAGVVEIGDTITVVNRGANALLVYPYAATGSVQGGAAGVGYSQGANTIADYRYTGQGTWMANRSS